DGQGHEDARDVAQDRGPHVPECGRSDQVDSQATAGGKERIPHGSVYEPPSGWRTCDMTSSAHLSRSNSSRCSMRWMTFTVSRSCCWSGSMKSCGTFTAR